MSTNTATVAGVMPADECASRFGVSRKTAREGSLPDAGPPDAAPPDDGSYKHDRAQWGRALVAGMAHAGRARGMTEAMELTQVAELARIRREEAAEDAHGAVAVRRVYWSDQETVERAIADEVAAALRISPAMAGHRIRMAEILVKGAPATLAALARGLIHVASAHRIAEGVSLLSAETAGRVERDVLARAQDQTPAQVAASVRRAVIAADPAAADRAYLRARNARSARCSPEDDAMASIWVSGTADRVSRAWQTVTAVAEHRRRLARKAATTRAATAATAARPAEHDPTGTATDGDGAADAVPTLAQARADVILDLLSSPDGLQHGRPDPTTPDPTTPDPATPDPATPDPASQDPGQGRASSRRASPEAVGCTHTEQGCTHTEPDGTHTEPGGTHTEPDGTHTEPDGTHTEPGGTHTEQLPAFEVTVNLVVPQDCLARRAGAPPAELVGHGPVPPAFVADLIGGIPSQDSRSDTAAARVRFTRWLTNPAGVVTTTSSRSFLTYRASPVLDATIRARDMTCRFPGCRTPARHCDLDHTIPHPTGETSARNLACLCRRHHRLKTHARWTLAQLPGAVLEWTSPTGHTYVTRPPDWANTPPRRAHPGRTDHTPVESPLDPTTAAGREVMTAWLTAGRRPMRRSRKIRRRSEARAVNADGTTWAPPTHGRARQAGSA